MSGRGRTRCRLRVQFQQPKHEESSSKCHSYQLSHAIRNKTHSQSLWLGVQQKGDPFRETETDGNFRNQIHYHLERIRNPVMLCTLCSKDKETTLLNRLRKVLGQQGNPILLLKDLLKYSPLLIFKYLGFLNTFSISKCSSHP